MPRDASERKYSGGSWRGITKHLGYIQNMGFDGVCTSPVSANLEDAPQGETYRESCTLILLCATRSVGFNMSGTKDYDCLTFHIGTANDLHPSNNILHRRSMYLFLISPVFQKQLRDVAVSILGSGLVRC